MSEAGKVSSHEQRGHRLPMILTKKCMFGATLTEMNTNLGAGEDIGRGLQRQDEALDYSSSYCPVKRLHLPRNDRAAKYGSSTGWIMEKIVAPQPLRMYSL